MTNYEIIAQLKGLKTISPEKEWVDLTYVKLLSNIDIDERESSGNPFYNIYTFFSTAIRGRVAYSAVAAFVLVFGVFSVTFTREASDDIDAITASILFSGPLDQKVKIFIEESESVVGKDVALEVKRIADEAGASFTGNALSSKNDDNGDSDTEQDNSSDPDESDSEAISNESSYTVVFKENSDSKDRFKRIIKDTIEVKLYDISQALKDRDEKVKRQIETILGDVRKAYADGELIEAFELVNAAEKSLSSIEESK